MSFRFLDRWQVRLLNASLVQDAGLLRTLQLCLDGAPEGKNVRRLPKLYWLGDALPRMILGPGQIFVTPGLVGLLPENELRAVLAEGVQKVSRYGFSMKRLTFFGALASGVLKLAPQEWVEMVFLARSGKSHVLSDEKSPLGFIWFLMILSGVGFLHRLGGKSVDELKARPSDLYRRATDRISRVSGDADAVRFIGFSKLEPSGLGMKKNLLSLARHSS